MDIASLKPSERMVEITSPGDPDEKIGIRVSLLSISDPALKALRRKFEDKKLELERRGKNWKAEQLEANRKELAFAAMTGWDWYAQEEVKDDKGNIVVPAREAPTFKGKKPTFDRATVFQLFDELEWFLNFILKEAGEEQAFFGK